MISQARKAQAYFAMIAIVMAGALVGSPPSIGIHQDCIDDANNDGGNPLTWDGIDLDGGVGGNPVNYGAPDGPDMECLDYPWADGNGEEYTPHEARYQSDLYESTTFQVWMDYNNGCAVVQFGGLIPSSEDGSQAQYQATCQQVP